jgi:hypothetical protein
MDAPIGIDETPAATKDRTRRARLRRWERREEQADAAEGARQTCSQPLPDAVDDPELDSLFDRQLHPDKLAAIASRRGIRAGRVLDWIAGQARPEAAGLVPPDVRLRAALALLDILRAPPPPQAQRAPGLSLTVCLANLPGAAGRPAAITVTAEPVTADLPQNCPTTVPMEHNKCYATLPEAAEHVPPPATAPPHAGPASALAVAAPTPPAPGGVPALTSPAPAAGGSPDFRVPSDREGVVATLSPPNHAAGRATVGGVVLRWRDGRAEWERGVRTEDERR